MSECNCKKDKCLSPAVLQINNQECPVVFHKVTLPAAMGDDITNPPRNGQYRNVLLVYEANGHVYMFSSDGIPTLISDGGQGVDDYNELTNKPSIEGHELVGDSSLEDIGVTDAIEDALEDYSPTSEFAEVAFTGDYDDLIGTPAIPTQTSDLTNDGSDGTSTYVEADELATVATSGSYNDLNDKPTIPAAQVNSDWNASSGVAQILNKPTLATVATSGSYNDLSDKPTIPAAQVNSDWNANSGVAQILNKPTLATVATTGDYDDLINKPTPITVDSALSWTSQNPVENQTIRKTIYVKNSSNDKEAGINIAFSDPNLSPYVHLGSKTSATRGINSVGIGNNAEASAVRSVAIGNAATASKREGVALGPNATAGQYSLSIGYYTETVPNYSTAVGPYAKVLTGATNATAIGYQSEASEAETVSVGKSTNKRRIVNVADGTTATDAATVGQIPTKTSDLTNDGADNTSTYVEADELAAVATSGSYNDLSGTPAIPSYSDFTGATSSVAGASGLVPAPAAGDDTKFLSGDGTWKTVSGGSSYTAGNGISIDANNEISIDDTVVAELSDLPTDFTGATASVAGAHGLVPAPAAGDQGKVLHGDGTWKDATAKLVEMSYGESNAWAKFIAAYNAGSIVYCRASSNANPATGSQTRKAFMAYVNNATNPTSVEFQYVRSVSSKTASQPVDQVFVYTLTSANGGTWTVTTRNMGPKLAQGTNTTVSYSNGTYTISATQPTVNDATLTIQQNGADVQTFTANQSTNATANITVPTKTSDLTNDGADNTSTYVEADELATVATTGDYSDLSGTPTIPTVNDALLTITQKGSTLGTFTANASSAKTINITAPYCDGLYGQAQTAAYHRSVIALCEVTTTAQSSNNSWFCGRIAFHRDNGLSGVEVVNINMENQYYKAYYTNVSYYSNFTVLGSTASKDTAIGWRPCTFKYNNVYYGGIEICTNIANHNVIWYETIGNFTPFGVDYYSMSHGSTASSVLNSEINNSISFTQWDEAYNQWHVGRATRDIIYDNGSGTNANFTTTSAMSNYDEVEISYRDGNQNYALKRIPGAAGSFALDIAHPGANNTVYWYISRYMVSGKNVTVGANNTRKAIGASSITTTASQDIYITRITGIKY